MENYRAEEIMASITSFSKDKYCRSELLNEMFALQGELVELTFEDDPSDHTSLKIWDVEEHLDKKNRECGGVADSELAEFKNQSKKLCNIIKAEVSGYRGEAKAFYALQGVRTSNIILRNIELSNDLHRTELDAVVITPGYATIVEVKNTPRSIFIDEAGNYYRTGRYLSRDCNLANKMSLRERMLGAVLTKNGITNVKIRSIVVFTDNRIEVENRNRRLRTCFLSQLPYIIDDFECSTYRSSDELERIAAVIRSEDHKIEYPFSFDIEQYKRIFATLLAKLEAASAHKEEPHWVEVEIDDRDDCKESLGSIFTSKRVTAAMAAILPLVAGALIRRGLFR